MKIQTANSNVVQAIEAQNGILDRNLPVYVTDYTVTVPEEYSPQAIIQWSKVAFLPSFEERQRNFNVTLCSLLSSDYGGTGGLSQVSFVFDFSSVAQQYSSQFNITLQGPLEGYLTCGDVRTSLSAYRYISYAYDASVYRLLLNVKQIPPLAPETSIPLFLDITIKDDVDDPGYPVYYPAEVASKILRIPYDEFVQGQGIRIVLPLLVCCPEEILTLIISSLDMSAPGAFNPIPQIQYLLLSSGVIYPNTPDIEFVADASYVIPPGTEPIEWQTNDAMRNMCYQLECLFSVVPACTAIVLFGTYEDPTGSEPKYMTWLKNNTSSYDIVCAADYQYSRTTYTDAVFSALKVSYDSSLETIRQAGKPVLCPSGDEGTNDQILFPYSLYNFVVANPSTITFGSFLLSPPYIVSMDYIVSTTSNGGYGNVVTRPPYQNGLVLTPKYGCPDIAGYYGTYKLCIHVGDYINVADSDLTIQAYAGLLAMIMQSTGKMDWDFKDIIYRKALTFVEYIGDGYNLGNSTSDQYLASDYLFWNPISGLGKLNGNLLYISCDTIKANSYIQISLASNAMADIGFLNIMPPNPFADLQTRQPVFGCSSIFSIFKIVNANSPDSSAPLTTTSVVYFVDVTGRYALSYSYDVSNRYYMTVSTFNVGSNAQKWYLFNYDNVGSVEPIFGYQQLQIAPFIASTLSMTSIWNAMNADVPGSPSITPSPGLREAFVLCHDPGYDIEIDDIKMSIEDDVTANSYYVNFTNSYAVLEDPMGTVPIKNITYLHNPFLLSMESTDTDINSARNVLYNSTITPKWSNTFEKYPEWVVVPVPCSMYNPLNTPYEQELLNGGQFMIFNTVLQSYICMSKTISGTPVVVLKPISSLMKTSYRFSDFVFTLMYVIDQTITTTVKPLFDTVSQTIPRGYPADAFYKGYSTVVSIFNRSMGDVVANGQTLYYTWDEPYLSNTQPTSDLTVIATEGNYKFSTLTGVFWVFKKFILNQQQPVRFISAFLNIPPSAPVNTGKAISLYTGGGNANNHAPSMKEYSSEFNSLQWRLRSNTTVDDLHVPPNDASKYIYLDENLTAGAITSTELQIVSILSAPGSLNDYAITVYGSRPQPIIAELPFTLNPDSIRWNGSSNNTFFTTPYTGNILPKRTNYLYVNRLYSFFTLQPYNMPYGKAGFLSSDVDAQCAPSIFGSAPKTQSGTGDIYYNGNASTTFAMTI